jgi:transposase
MSQELNKSSIISHSFLKKIFLVISVSKAMNQLSQEQRRLIVGQFYSENKSFQKSYTWKHFRALGLKRSFVYDVMQSVDNKKSLIRKPGSGRPAVKMNKKRIKELCSKVDGKLGISQAKLGMKYNCSQQYISHVLSKCGIKYRKRKIKPKTTEEQKVRQKQRLLKLSKTYFRPKNGISVVMDDESYFQLGDHNMPGNDGYYCSEGKVVDVNVKYKSKTKFPSQVLVWIGISEKGCTRPYFIPKNNSINGKIYSNECIRKRLVPFIRLHHNNDHYIFFPDGASAHYAKQTIETFEKFDIRYIKRAENPPNIPQLRPIEKFWSHLKAKVYEKGWTANNSQQLIARIRSKLREFSPNYFSDLFCNFKTNIRKGAERGPEFVFK